MCICIYTYTHTHYNIVICRLGSRSEPTRITCNFYDTALFLSLIPCKSPFWIPTQDPWHSHILNGWVIPCVFRSEKKSVRFSRDFGCQIFDHIRWQRREQLRWRLAWTLRSPQRPCTVEAKLLSSRGMRRSAGFQRNMVIPWDVMVINGD